MRCCKHVGNGELHLPNHHFASECIAKGMPARINACTDAPMGASWHRQKCKNSASQQALAAPATKNKLLLVSHQFGGDATCKECVLAWVHALMFPCEHACHSQ